ncbi:complement receptor type 2 isoform X3 [Cuculus canorus]|uniref:complement receptor type 2 isoform X3 n=1 Tax=Cuculus canorus TaxID=55661 RepID=UPI0023AA9362|nr:complement receptor type 2 isoform X3 [Cuculus canorus]
MVLTFALHLLGSSALLLAVAARAQAAYCPVPRIRNGKRVSIGRGFYRAGDTVSFVCNTGYTLHGSHASRCRADSRWSPPLPVCKKEVMCPRPPNIANGLHSGQSLNKFSQGATVYYSCKDGYQLLGNISISCSEAGVWSRPLPRCEAIGCEIPEVQNGKVHDPQSTYKAGETLHFDCDAGYAAEGTYKAQCQPGGTWDPPVLICERVQPCPTPLGIPNGHHNGKGKVSFTMGMSVTYTCDPGYYLVGNAVVFCRASGSWSQPSPRCAEVMCPRPPNIANGLHSGQSLNKFSRRATVYYSCKDGYQVLGNISISCSEAGVWSRPLPRCEAIGCEIPEVQNGKVHDPQSTYKAGETLHFDCDAGYAAEGTYKAQCQPGGTWNPPVLICERVQPCPTPPGVPNGHHNGQGKAFFTTGMSVTYTCDPGYYLVGNAVVFCRAPGSWSQPSPRCAVTVCINPDIANGRRADGQGLLSAPGQTVTFQCQDGYSLRGSAQTFCQEDGSWHPPVPVCDKIHHNPTFQTNPQLPGGCGAPPRLHFAELKEEHRNEIDFSVGKMVQYTCRPGYAKAPGMSPTVTCLQSGVWSEALEFCKRKQCGHPGEPVNGKITFLTDLLFGSTVRYSCEEGHRLIGQSSRRCEISGGRVAWSGDLPTCQRIPCEPPPDIPNGKHTGTLLDEFHFGTSVTYTCDPGYPLQGEPSIHCTTQDGTNGVWSGQPPRCGEARCPVPQIQNGRIVSPPGTAYTHKDTVAFECEPGYVLRGHRVVQCQLNDTWEPPVPFCEQAGCNAPTHLVFAELKELYRNQTVFPVGRTVEYVCQPGYAQQPGMPLTITCLGNRTWSAALEFCRRKQCPNPEDVENGRAVVLTDLLFGSKVNYTCDEGYKLVGGSQRTCEVSGARVSWSGDAPLCHRITCDPPPDIPHGTHSGHLRDTFSYADVVTYTCDAGHPLAGEPSISCTSSDGAQGVWSGPPPRCGEVKCPPPPGIANGKHSSQPSDIHLPGSAVRYSCMDGYSLIGNASITCTARGTWSRPQPRCEATGCKTPEIKNGRTTGLETVYRPADTVVFECNFGYALKGSQESQCQFGGTWDPPVPICEEMPQCPSPPNIKNGKHEAKDVEAFIPGTSVKYSCDPGYVLTGKTAVLCLTTGTWSIPYPRCEVITCSSPDIPNGAVADGQSAVYHPGANVTFQCRPGYVLGGSREAKCQPDGRWAPTVPTCQPVLQCSPPPNINNGYHNSQDLEVFTPGMVVNYSCDPGYSLLGEESIYCTDSGNWSLPLPQCAGGCGSPPNLTFAELSEEYQNLTEFAVGETVRYKCQPGYTRHSRIPSTLTCLKNHSWSEALAFCQRKRCKHPERPKNGRVVVLTDLHFGSTVNHTCDEGHRLVGQPYRRCELFGADVAWSGVLPICQKVMCPAPQIQNGRISVLKYRYTYKDTVSFKCHEGFTLRGHRTTWCQADKTWDPPIPTCEQDGLAEPYHHPDTTTEPAVKCPPPPRVANGEHGSHFIDAFDVGALVHYHCKQGFSLMGNKSVRCTTSGAWSHPPPRCEVVKCLHPPNITNGKLKGNISETFSYGASVSYSCIPGYSLVGNAFINCTVSGTWSQPPPRCEEIRCVFPEVQGVKKAVSGNTYRSGTKVTLECDDGYTLEGINQIQCQEDFSWDPPVPACKQASHGAGSVGLGKNLGGKFSFMQWARQLRFPLLPLKLPLIMTFVLLCFKRHSEDNTRSSPPGAAAAGALLLLGAGIAWKVISKQKEGYYQTYENYSYQTPLNPVTEQKCSCLPQKVRIYVPQHKISVIAASFSFSNIVIQVETTFPSIFW